MTTSRTAGTMEKPRSGHTTTTLSDGRVLVVGGHHRGKEYFGLATSEIWSENQFAPAGDLRHPRYDHRAVLLPSGNVLVVGGESRGDGHPEIAEIWDPADGGFREAGTLSNSWSRKRPSATLLANGKVLVVGERGGVEVWDPMNKAFTETQALEVKDTRQITFHDAIPISNNRVCVIDVSFPGPKIWASDTGTWKAGKKFPGPWHDVRAVHLVNDEILLLGTPKKDGSGAMIYDAARDTYTELKGPENLICWQQMTRLPNGDVLIFGAADGKFEYKHKPRFTARLSHWLRFRQGAFEVVSDVDDWQRPSTCCALSDDSVLFVGRTSDSTGQDVVIGEALLVRL